MATAATANPLAILYLEDETAWLETMADLVRKGDLAALDLDSLGEYLTDMAGRDRREVQNRLGVLLVHLLKWEYQRDKGSQSWVKTIVTQRRKLAGLAGRGVLKLHAEAVLPAAYDDAIEDATTETGLPASTFPKDCPYTIEGLFAMDLATFLAR